MAIHKDIQSVSEHQIYKTLAPLVSIALVGTVAWMFQLLLELENKSLKNEQAIIHMQGDSDDVWKDIGSMRTTLTDIRIYIGNGASGRKH